MRDGVRASSPHGEVAKVFVLNVGDETLEVAGSGDENDQAIYSSSDFSQLRELDVVAGPQDLLV